MSSQQKGDTHACRKEGTRVKNVRDVANRCAFSMIRGC